MKRLTMLLLLTLWSVPQMWSASANLTTNGSACPAATNTTAIVVNLPQDDGGATLTVSGTWTGTISFYGTGSGGGGGPLWTALNATPLGSSTAVTSTTSNGTWQVNVAGFTGVCMLSSASMTGTANVTVNPSAASARSNGGSSSGSGTVTSVTCGAGLSGGTITTSGTCAVIAASGASNYPLCSAVSGGSPSSGICTVTVTNAQLLALGATPWAPLQIFPAQGSGIFPDIDYVMMQYVCNSCTGMTVTGAPFLQFYWVDTSNSTTATVAAVGFLDQTTSNSAAWINLFVYSIGFSSQPTPLPSSILSNANLILACANGVSNCSNSDKWASGTGSLFLTITYHMDIIK
jgi:hypothetical protein